MRNGVNLHLTQVNLVCNTEVQKLNWYTFCLATFLTIYNIHRNIQVLKDYFYILRNMLIRLIF